MVTGCGLLVDTELVPVPGRYTRKKREQRVFYFAFHVQKQSVLLLEKIMFLLNIFISLKYSSSLKKITYA